MEILAPKDIFAGRQAATHLGSGCRLPSVRVWGGFLRCRVVGKGRALRVGYPEGVPGSEGFITGSHVRPVSLDSRTPDSSGIINYKLNTSLRAKVYFNIPLPPYFNYSGGSELGEGVCAGWG